MQNFVAIDFETANFQPSSVCSVGICIVKDGEIVDNYYSLIRPVPNSRVQHHDRKGRYRSTKSTGDMGFRFPHHNFASCVGDPIEKVFVDQSPIKEMVEGENMYHFCIKMQKFRRFPLKYLLFSKKNRNFAA